MSFAAKIGVLLDSPEECPNQHPLARFILDAEDHNNATKYSGDDKKPIGIRGEKEVDFSYCVLDYDELVKVPYDYVVLRLDDKCPNGAMAFARYHDTEDKNNINRPKNSFKVWPSVINKDAKLEYCFVPADKNAKYQYPFKKQFGVFANPSSSSSIVRNQVKIDDEDSNNENGWDWHDIKDQSIKNRIMKIVEDGKDVVYHTIKWKGAEDGLPPISSLWRTTVGVIKVDNKASCQRQFTITLDVEDHNNNTQVTGGVDDHPGIDFRSNNFVDFKYCVIETPSNGRLPRARYDYVVLRTSRYCPLGSKPFTRYHDTENKNNKNAPKGSSAVWPSVINDDAKLEYCLVHGGAGGVAYPFSASYGIFADNPNINNIVYTEFRVDDEDDKKCYKEEWVEEFQIESNPKYDDNGEPVTDDDGSLVFENTTVDMSHYDCKEKHNKNAWKFSVLSNLYFDIMYEKKEDTYFRYIHWNGKALSKSAEAIVAAPAVGEIAPVAAGSILTPEIKGFDHSAVTVELKSAGKVVISIMNIRGDVVATVSQDNMQPGIHMVNWNSGTVPNGRYVVAVKQNGKFSAKNVILK